MSGEWPVSRVKLVFSIKKKKKKNRPFIRRFKRVVFNRSSIFVRSVKRTRYGSRIFSDGSRKKNVNFYVERKINEWIRLNVFEIKGIPLFNQ